MPKIGNILEPRTAAEYRLPGDTSLHARTVKVNDVHCNKGLRETVNAGMNHVPLQPTVYPPNRDALHGVWEEFVVHRSGLMLDHDLLRYARRVFFSTAYERFQTGLQENRGGHRFMTPGVWDILAAKL